MTSMTMNGDDDDDNDYYNDDDDDDDDDKNAIKTILNNDKVIYIYSQCPLITLTIVDIEASIVRPKHSQTLVLHEETHVTNASCVV